MTATSSRPLTTPVPVRDVRGRPPSTRRLRRSQVVDPRAAHHAPTSPDPHRRRLLFVVPPFVAAVDPALAVARRLTALGHDVAWVGDPGLLARAPGRVFPTRFDAPLRPAGARGSAAREHLWEQVLVPFAEDTAPVVARAIDAVAPDVVVADQGAFAGGLLAERRRLKWATTVATPAVFTAPGADRPEVVARQQALLAGLRDRLGVRATGPDPRWSPHLVLVFSTPELTGPLPLPPQAPAWVGPALVDTPPPAAPRRRSDTRPAVVRMGGADGDAARILGHAEAAFTDGSAASAIVVDPEVTTPVRRHGVLRVGPADRLEVLRRAGAVVCRGEHDEVCESLWYGLPLVVAPVDDLDDVVAERVVRAGAGVRVRADRVDAAGLAAAVAQVTSAASYRESAARLGASFRAAGGAARAAQLLAALCRPEVS